MEQIKANETLVDSSLRETKMHGTVDFPVGVYLDDFSDFKNGYICWHWHEEIQISWIIEGEFLCQMEGRTVHLHPGELIFVNRGVLHQIYPVQKGYGKLYAFIWDPEFLSGSADGAVYQEAFEAMLPYPGRDRAGSRQAGRGRSTAGHCGAVHAAPGTVSFADKNFA